MRHRELILCTLLLFSVLATFTPQVHASFVTETSSYITIENDYYIANFTKGYHGKISHFYIKPETSINIVAWAGQWNFLGGHENPTSWNGTEKSIVDWGLGTYKQSQTTEIVYQTSSAVVVKSVSKYKQTASVLNITTTDYYAFYADKPYYLVSIKRTFNENVKKNYNYQYCWLLNNTWANTYYRVDHNNTIDTITGITEEDSVGIGEAQYLQKYPWAMLYNTTYNAGHFSILLSANPHTTSIGMLGTAANQYKEYQLMWYMDEAASGESFYATVLNGVATSSSYVDNLASSLWSNDVIQADNDRLLGVSSNAKIETDQRKNRITATTLPSTSFFHSNLIYLGHDNSEYENGVFLGDEDNILNEWQLHCRYANATSEYGLWLAAGSTINQTNYFLNSTFTNITLTRQFEDKFKIELRTEMWADSDSYYQTYVFTLLKGATVSYLYTYYRISEPQAQFSMIELTEDQVVKVNMSTYYVSAMKDNGVVFKKISGNLSRIESERYATYSFLKFYAKYGGGATAYSAGAKWTIKLLVQPYKRYTSQGLGFFGLSDIKTPEQHQSEILTYHHRLSWARLIADTNQPFRFNHYGKGYLISESSFSSDTLKMRVVGESGTTSTINVYCGDKGEPENVENAQTWIYDSDTKILSFTVLHASDKQINVLYAKTASGNYMLDVYVQRDFLPASAKVEILGENKSTNLFGQTRWQLPYGTYIITAYQGVEKQSITILLNEDTTKTFNFITPPKLPPTNLLSLLGIGLLAIAVVVIYFMFFMRRRK